ncbi:hypothetical protein J437_LFUL018209 [Ladona fulva]|uniref:Uncharacterized protein n=1 Tax=Ladona fulva TaxID=123851 RepID=A0A8K0KTP8_LADFU|nr:hypothetical protein J437_LFUL018209 [Ladona fulva]
MLTSKFRLLETPICCDCTPTLLVLAAPNTPPVLLITLLNFALTASMMKPFSAIAALYPKLQELLIQVRPLRLPLTDSEGGRERISHPHHAQSPSI